MQLDYRQFVMKLEKLSEQKPLPYQDYVSKYVKAYYIPETDLEAWVKQHNTVRKMNFQFSPEFIIFTIVSGIHAETVGGLGELRCL